MYLLSLPGSATVSDTRLGRPEGC